MIKILLAFFIICSMKTFAWETTFELALPNTNPPPSRGDYVFHYLFSQDLLRVQNAKYINKNNNSVTTDNASNGASN